MYVMYVPMCRIPEEECFGVQTQTLKPYQTMWWQFFEFHHHQVSSLSLLSLSLSRRKLKVESTGVGITCELSSGLSEALLW